jgi:hypothetical protein
MGPEKEVSNGVSNGLEEQACYVASNAGMGPVRRPAMGSVVA